MTAGAKEALDYYRSVFVQAARTFLPGLVNPAIGVGVLCVALLVVSVVVPGGWMRSSMWEDIQKGVLVLVIYVALSFLVSLVMAPLRIHRTLTATIGGLQAAPMPVPVSPLQQSFTFIVTSPQQAGEIAQTIAAAANGGASTTLVTEGSNTATSAEPAILNSQARQGNA